MESVNLLQYIQYGIFPKLGVPFLGGPYTYNKDPSIVGFILGPLILGSYHIKTIKPQALGRIVPSKRRARQHAEHVCTGRTSQLEKDIKEHWAPAPASMHCF